jgi:UDP-glucose 4-epimerase
MDRPEAEKLRVAVTGGAGRIGSTLVKALLARGHEVVALDQRQPREPLCKFHFCDLRVREYVQPILETCNAVAHLGEIPSMNGLMSPEQLYTANCTIGSTVMQTAADLKIRRLIYTSSAQVYGAWGWPLVAPATMPITEETPLRPQNAYSCSKVANENYSHMLAETHDMSVTVIRIPWVVMEHDDFTRMRKWLAREGKGPMEGLGTYVHASDVVRGYIATLEKGETGWQAYNLSAKNVRLTVGMGEFLDQHFPTWPKPPSDWPANKSPLVTEKARVKLGWEASWDIHTAFPMETAASN